MGYITGFGFGGFLSQFQFQIMATCWTWLWKYFWKPRWITFANIGYRSLALDDLRNIHHTQEEQRWPREWWPRRPRVIDDSLQRTLMLQDLRLDIGAMCHVFCCHWIGIRKKALLHLLPCNIS